MDLSASNLHLHSNFAHQELQEFQESRSDSKSPATEKMQQPDQKKPRPPEDGPQECPRCESKNTKFCYYNNYSLTQPRYFCKACRRYWTKGGTLRNVPVGGGCRKSSKRASSVSNSPSQYLKRAHTHDSPMTSASVQTPVFAGIGNLQHGYGGWGGYDSLIGNGSFADPDAGVGYLGYPGAGFLQGLPYGNGGGGMMYQQGNFGNYEENNAGNSNCVSGVSDDVAAIVPYDDVTVKQERGQNDAFWWQSEAGMNMIESSAWSILNTAPALL